MKKLTILGLLAVAGIGNTAMLWDQSQLINRAGGGTGAIVGAHLSQLETTTSAPGIPSNETLFGAGIQGPPTNNVCADDFTLSTASTITGFSVFSYVTGSTVPTTTGVNWAIGGTPTIASGLATAASLGTFWNVGGQGVYRVVSTTTSDATRRIVITTVTGLNLNLAAGTYFLSASVNPGNFSPVLPWTNATHGRNMVQSINNAAFAPLVQGTAPATYGNDMAFIIDGQAVPEPATMAALGLGAVALIRRRRK